MSNNLEVILPADIKNSQHYFIGLAFRTLNCLRHRIFGYRTPRPFSMNQFERAMNYDFQVVQNWVKHLCGYLDTTCSFKDKIVLELGAGADLGIGLISLAMGAEKYVAFDVHNLAQTTPMEFYDKLLDRLKKEFPKVDTALLKDQLYKCYQGNGERLKYIVDKNFRISKLKDEFDMVFSQAAFEHFDNIEKTFQELSGVVKSGGVLITEIDLKTHTRWIRDKDPLNIYRYNDFLWNQLSFKGSPNRVRAFEYQDMLAKYGWTDIKIEPLIVLDEDYTKQIKPSLNKKYRNMDTSEIKMLSIMLMAQKE